MLYPYESLPRMLSGRLARLVLVQLLAQPFVNTRHDIAAGVWGKSVGPTTYEALVPYADACWAHGQRGRGSPAAGNGEAAAILLPTDRSFVACHPDGSMGRSDATYPSHCLAPLVIWQPV